MAQFVLGEGESLYFQHEPPGRDGAPTLVFVNALTGSAQSWEAVAAALRERGFGALSYNFRGQDASPFAPGRALTPELIVDDLLKLLDGLKPSRPVLVGLSIGGLFAAQAALRGAPAEGLVLLNTLREIGPRLSWVNDAMPLLVGAGGVQLLLDAYFPLLVNQDQTAAARPTFLKGGYAPLDPEHGHMNLMRHAGAADWALDYERLSMPVHVISGLQDRVFYDAETVDRLYARLPNATREAWEDAGHLLPMERPERLAESLAVFAQSVEERGA